MLRSYHSFYHNNPMKKTTLIIIILLALAALIFFLTRNDTAKQVSNFEECVAAGNPVMESYPQQCKHEDKTYTENVSNIPTSADNAPPGSIHNLPVPTAVAAVRSTVAKKLGINEGVAIVLTAFEKNWPNACLGLAGAEEMCAEVITPGYEVTIQASGKEYVYRTNADGSVIREE